MAPLFIPETAYVAMPPCEFPLRHHHGPTPAFSKCSNSCSV